VELSVHIEANRVVADQRFSEGEGIPCVVHIAQGTSDFRPIELQQADRQDRRQGRVVELFYGNDFGYRLEHRRHHHCVVFRLVATLEVGFVLRQDLGDRVAYCLRHRFWCLLRVAGAHVQGGVQTGLDERDRVERSHDLARIEFLALDRDA
jgi:hypothetical protein